MPGVSLEEPYPLATFTTFTSARKNRFSVDCIPTGIVSASAVNDVESTSDSDNVMLTIQGNGVNIYNTTDQKCLKSWSTPPDITFACPARYHNKSAERYVYVVIATGSDLPVTEEGKVVWMWHDRDNVPVAPQKGLDAKTVKKFEKKIFSLEVSPVLSSHILLVNEDGTISMVTDDLKRTVGKCEPLNGHQTTTTLWCTLFITSSLNLFVPPSILPYSSTIVATVISTLDSTGPWTLVLYYVDSERLNVEVLASVTVDSTDGVPIAFSLDSSVGKFSVLFPNGYWKVYSILFFNTTTATKISLSESLSLSLQNSIFTGINSRDLYPHGHSVAVTSIKDNYVGFLTSRKNTQTDQLDFVLLIWDILYGTLQAERLINISDRANSLHNEFSFQLISLPNAHLILTLSSPTNKSSRKNAGISVKTSVLVCPYYCAPISLMGAMNKMKSTTSYFTTNEIKNPMNKNNADRFKNRLTETNNTSQIQDVWHSNLIIKASSIQRLESALLSQLAEAAKTSATNNFTKVFMEYVGRENENILSGQTEPNGDVECMDVDTRTHEDLATEAQGFVDLSHNVVLQIVTQCFSRLPNGSVNTNFWPSTVVRYLIEKQFLTNGMVEGGIINTLIEREDWNLLELSLQFVPDIPENDLILLIKHVMGLYRNNEDKPKSMSFAYVLGSVIAAPRNNILMQEALRNLNVEELQMLLDCLCLWVKEKKEGEPKCNQPDERTLEAPSFPMIIDFLTIVIDTHSPTLILTPSFHPLLTTLNEHITTEMELAKQTEELRGCLSLFRQKEQESSRRRKTVLTKKEKFQKRKPWEATGANMPDYTIEIIHL